MPDSTRKNAAEVSLFIGRIGYLKISGRPSAIDKQPVEQPVFLSESGFLGDEQADRRVHGGPEKAVHLYPAGHYSRLAECFPEIAGQLQAGALGENLSCATLDENDVHIGDIWQLGSARLQVCQPRNPCWKIDERLGCDGVAAHIAEFRLTGWYLRVLSSGEVCPGDRLLLQQPANEAMTLAAAMQLSQQHRPDVAAFERLLNTPGIASQWRDKLEQRLVWLRKNN